MVCTSIRENPVSFDSGSVVTNIKHSKLLVGSLLFRTDADPIDIMGGDESNELEACCVYIV